MFSTDLYLFDKMVDLINLYGNYDNNTPCCLLVLYIASSSYSKNNYIFGLFILNHYSYNIPFQPYKKN